MSLRGCEVAAWLGALELFDRLAFGEDADKRGRLRVVGDLGEGVGGELGEVVGVGRYANNSAWSYGVPTTSVSNDGRILGWAISTYDYAAMAMCDVATMSCVVPGPESGDNRWASPNPDALDWVGMGVPSMAYSNGMKRVYWMSHTGRLMERTVTW